MDLRQLRYFIEVAHSRNFRAAAQRLHIAQSSLSRRVADLELSLGVTLFDRNSRGVDLTQHGQRLLARAEELLQNFAAVEAELSDKASMGGVVTVGTSDAVSRMLLAPLVAKLSGPASAIDLHFVEGAQYVLFEGLDAGRIDLAVMTTPEAIPTCKMQVILHEPLHLITRFSERPKKKVVQIQELAHTPLVMFPRPSGNRNYLDAKAAEAGTTLICRYETSNTAAQREFVREGLARCILPLSAVVEHLGRKGLAATPIAGLSLTRTLVWRADRPQSPAVVRVAEVIRTVMVDHKPEGARISVTPA